MALIVVWKTSLRKISSERRQVKNMTCISAQGLYIRAGISHFRTTIEITATRRASIC